MKFNTLMAAIWGVIAVAYIIGSIMPSSLLSALMAAIITINHIIESLEDGGRSR